MKRKSPKVLVSLLLALALLCSLAVPVSAGSAGTAYQANTLSVGDCTTAIIDTNGDLWMWGSFYREEPAETREEMAVPAKILSDAVSISCGGGFYAAIKSDGSLWTWGRNTMGQLGNGTHGDTAQVTPAKIMDDVIAVSCGSSHACAIKEDGSLWAWGSNQNGKIGNGGTGTDVADYYGNTYAIQETPVKVLDNVVSAECSTFYTAAQKEDGSLWIWGSYQEAEVIGIERNLSTPVKIKDNVSKFWCNLFNYRLSYLDASGKMVVLDGDSGSPVMDNVQYVSMLSDSAGSRAFLLEDGSLWMCGSNTYGMLGTGQSTDDFVTTPVKVMENVAAVNCGYHHVAAVKTDGSVWCWGYNDFGEVGNGGKGDNTFVDYPTQNTIPFQATPCQVPGLKARLPGTWSPDAEEETLFQVAAPANVTHGKVTVSASQAKEGDVITVTTTPEDGYRVEAVTVASESGNVAVTNTGEGKYVFTHPNSKVTITVTFVEEPDTDHPFTDVNPGEYYYDPVLWAVENEITNGISATEFGPGNTCTREQAMTFLWRAAGEPEPKTTSNPFTDVKPDAYSYKAVLWAVENGITNGMSATEFGPSETCTRAQIVTFLHRADEAPTVGSSNPFADVKQGDYYYNAVLWAVENNITNGMSATEFGPSDGCTRGQIVTFLYRHYA